MGGRSSSSSSSSSSTSTVQTDERIAATDNANVLKVDGSNNTFTDLDAVSKAGELALAALNSQGQIAMQALNQTQAAVDSLGAGADKVFEFVDTQNRDEEQRTLTQLTPWLLVGVSVLALTGSLKIGG